MDGVEGSLPFAGQQCARGVFNGCQDEIVHLNCRHLPHDVIQFCLPSGREGRDHGKFPLHGEVRRPLLVLCVNECLDNIPPRLRCCAKIRGAFSPAHL
jgi:hypothetical protein